MRTCPVNLPTVLFRATGSLAQRTLAGPRKSVNPYNYVFCTQAQVAPMNRECDSRSDWGLTVILCGGNLINVDALWR